MVVMEKDKLEAMIGVAVLYIVASHRSFNPEPTEQEAFSTWSASSDARRDNTRPLNSGWTRRVTRTSRVHRSQDSLAKTLIDSALLCIAQVKASKHIATL